MHYEISFTNTGFATVINPHQVHLVFIGEDGKIAADCLLADAQPKSWQPYDPESGTYEVLVHSLRGKVKFPAGSGNDRYLVGLWMPDAMENMHGMPAYDIKWADVPVKYIDGKAVNIVGEVD